MILVNLTREEQGTKELLQVGSALKVRACEMESGGMVVELRREMQGFHVFRLVELFSKPPQPFKISEDEKSLFRSYDVGDTYQFVGHIFTNISQVPDGRDVLVDPERRMDWLRCLGLVVWLTLLSSCYLPFERQHWT